MRVLRFCQFALTLLRGQDAYAVAKLKAQEAEAEMRALTATERPQISSLESVSHRERPSARPLPYQGTSLDIPNDDVQPAPAGVSTLAGDPSPIENEQRVIPVQIAAVEDQTAAVEENSRKATPGNSKLDELKAKLAQQKAERENAAAQQSVSAQVPAF